MFLKYYWLIKKDFSVNHNIVNFHLQSEKNVALDFPVHYFLKDKTKSLFILWKFESIW